MSLLCFDGSLQQHAHLSKYGTWAARYNTCLLIRWTPKGAVFSFLFYLSTGRNEASMEAIGYAIRQMRSAQLFKRARIQTQQE